jgi:hypothetical protein
MTKVELYGNLDSVVRTLISFRENGFDVCCDFNGHTLYSRDVTLDSAYLEVTGYTYRAYLQKQKEVMDEYRARQEKEKEEARAKKPEWIERGRKLIPQELWAKWEECLDIRIHDLYNGTEVEGIIQIMEAHKAGKSIDEIYSILEAQHHSGASYGIAMSIIRYFYSEELCNQLQAFEETKRNEAKNNKKPTV